MYQAMLDQSRKIGTFGHGFTYSGHPVAAAVALKTLEIYERERLVEKAAQHGAAVPGAARGAWRAHPLVGEARGYGLVGAVELVADKATKRSFDPKAGVGPRAAAFAEAEGLLLRFLAGDVLSICPPLVITPQEIDELFDRLGRALDRTLDWARRERLARGLSPQGRQKQRRRTLPGAAANPLDEPISRSSGVLLATRGLSGESPCRGASTTTIAPIFTRL